jgi:hypothetical protein
MILNSLMVQKKKKQIVQISGKRSLCDSATLQK